MSRALAKKDSDELRPEYDLSELKGGVRGKYYKKATRGTNLVLIDPDLSETFPDTDAVNRALRTLVDAARTTIGLARHKRLVPNETLQRTQKPRPTMR